MSEERERPTFRSNHCTRSPVAAARLALAGEKQ